MELSCISTQLSVAKPADIHSGLASDVQAFVKPLDMQLWGLVSQVHIDPVGWRPVHWQGQPDEF